jgi:hypothetical protein
LLMMVKESERERSHDYISENAEIPNNLHKGTNISQRPDMKL